MTEHAHGHHHHDAGGGQISDGPPAHDHDSGRGGRRQRFLALARPALRRGTRVHGPHRPRHRLARHAQAGRRADDSRTYGYHRTGILAALTNAITLILIVVGIAYEASRRL